MARAPKQEILNQDKLEIPKEYLRFATPASVALYRAERLKCNIIADIGCGIGGQAMAFAKICKKVIAVEIDEKQLEIAKENAKKLGIKNIEFVYGDALAIMTIEKVQKFKPDIIFCDTQRKESGERSIDDLQPDIKKLIDKYSFCKKIAIELPPFTKDLERLKENEFEKEFISLNGKLNRLTIYLNELKKSERSAIALPSETRLENRKTKKTEIADSAKGFKYIYIIDPAITMAELVNELGEEFKAKLLEIDGKTFFVSNEILKSAFLYGFRILEVCKHDFPVILENLKKLDAGQVVLRYNLKPEDYWKERNKYENELSGEKVIHLFANEEAVLCENLTEK